MIDFRCMNCGSHEFEPVETEVRLRMPGRKEDYYEIRQEEPCCIHCTWVPSDHLDSVSVIRKIPLGRPHMQYGRML